MSPTAKITGFRISVCRCPVHQDFCAVSIDTDYDDRSGFGQRITDSKCCGQWIVKSWPLTERSTANMLRELQRVQRYLRKFSRDALAAGEPERTP